MDKDVTFGLEPARAYWDAGGRELEVYTAPTGWLGPVSGRPVFNDLSYRLVPGTKPTAEQVSAIVKAESGRLAAECDLPGSNSGDTYAWIDGRWRLWYDGDWDAAYADPDCANRAFYLALRPDLEPLATPEAEQKHAPFSGDVAQALWDTGRRGVEVYVRRTDRWGSLGAARPVGGGDKYRLSSPEPLTDEQAEAAGKAGACVRDTSYPYPETFRSHKSDWQVWTVEGVWRLSRNGPGAPHMNPRTWHIVEDPEAAAKGTTPENDTFWDNVREIAEQQRTLPDEIRALADVPSEPFHRERLPKPEPEPDSVHEHCGGDVVEGRCQSCRDLPRANELVKPEPEPVHDAFGREAAPRLWDAGVPVEWYDVTSGWRLFRGSPMLDTPYRLATQEPLDPDTAERIARALEGWEMHFMNSGEFARRFCDGVVEMFCAYGWQPDSLPDCAFAGRTWHLRRPGTAERMARERGEARLPEPAYDPRHDKVRAAMLRAAERFGGDDGKFNLANFSAAFRAEAGLSATRALDGTLCQAILSGRCDVEQCSPGDAHYRALSCSQPAPEPKDPPRRHAELTFEQAQALRTAGFHVACPVGRGHVLVNDRPLDEDEAARVQLALPGAVLTESVDGWWLESVPAGQEADDDVCKQEAWQAANPFTETEERRYALIALVEENKGPGHPLTGLLSEYQVEALEHCIGMLRAQEPAEESPLPRETSSLVELAEHAERGGAWFPSKPSNRDRMTYEGDKFVRRWIGIDRKTPYASFEYGPGDPPWTLLPADPPEPPVEHPEQESDPALEFEAHDIKVVGSPTTITVQPGRTIKHLVVVRTENEPKPPVEPRHDRGQVLVWMIQTGRWARGTDGCDWRWDDERFVVSRPGELLTHGDPGGIAPPCTPADGKPWEVESS